MNLVVVPITLRLAQAFVLKHHRHTDPPTVLKFAIGLVDSSKQIPREVDALVGVAVTARPGARELDDGLTIEVSRTCTDGTKNANSKLYGACWAAARAMGYVRGVTYTEEGESGISLKAAGWRMVATLPARPDWKASTKKRLTQHYPQDGLFDAEKKTKANVMRYRWEINA